MKKIKKAIAGIIVSALAFTATFSFTGCFRKEKLVRDEKTINIRACIGGYGDSWLRALADKFNEAYADKGYKANVLASSTDLEEKVAMKELYTKDDWADLYFVNVNNTMSQFTAEGGEYGQLVADLTDTVWNRPAINFKGEEESGKLISEKMRVSLPDDVLKVNGRVYGFNTSNDIGGMIVNTAKLAKYGVNRIPKTTNELFKTFELIYTGDASRNIKGSLESQIYPVTFLGGDNGYPIHFVTAWQAQYAGIADYERFYGYTDENGNEMIDDGYKVYGEENVSLEKMLEAMFNMYDKSFVALGSNNNTIDTAHTKLMSDKGGAVFMSDGNWAYNEIITNYQERIENLAFANVPVLSAVGVKLFGKQTAYGFDDDLCEEILSLVIDKTDEGKTAEEIVAEVKTEKGLDLKEAEVTEVMKARGIYCSRSSLAAGAFVAEKSKVKEICYLFLRMFASDDNATLYNRECNGFTAYMSDFSQAKDTTYNKQCKAIVESKYATPVWMNATDLRLKVGHNNLIFPNSDLSFVSKIIGKGATIYKNGEKTGDKSLYTKNADEMLAEVRKYAKEHWAEWIKDVKK